MKTKLVLILLLATMALSAAPRFAVGVGYPHYGYSAYPHGFYPRGPVPVAGYAPYPGPGYAWVGGYWEPYGGRYAWRAGYWGRPPYAGAAWVAPRYYGGRFVRGYWRR